ncbi:hypothetical protein T4B_3389 [Trichinella pseudospiralis]|uniref:Uncharacterized protein n=2 Tax=Trichinella pseudospiralis TaxID=6337 RepID=A0A0V1G3H4_TRIPS|nr:hypothetical protein T4A_2075 [Trichinella pseudospiralis]KRY74826.1 hypothetical protein T4A_4306 [Trichinella pseudospiralis]KRY92636.1 hypothetical protein T4D_14411 [Trichinella pseudospiralis]KRZ34957.1 hypothetical protein T4B_3389 [Trichinella pseudospiralis]KRZ44100.1 hypothetical protein T4C_2222 [Trichinella pseudospiralis]
MFQTPAVVNLIVQKINTKVHRERNYKHADALRSWKPTDGNCNAEQSNPLVDSESETDPHHIPSATDYDFLDDTTPPKQQNQLFTQEYPPVSENQQTREQLTNNVNIVEQQTSSPTAFEESVVLKCQDANGEPTVSVPTTGDQQQPVEDDAQLEIISPTTPAPRSVETTIEVHQGIPIPSTANNIAHPPSEYEYPQQHYTSYPRPAPRIHDTYVQRPILLPAHVRNNYQLPSEPRPQLNFPTNSVSQLFSISRHCYPNCASQQTFLIPPPPSIPLQPMPCAGTINNCKQRRFKRFIFHI